MDGRDYVLALVVAGAYVACAAWCGIVLRRLVVPSWRGPLALLGATILALSVFVVVAELLGAVGLFGRWVLLAGLLVAAAVATWLDRRSSRGSEPSTVASPGGRLEPTEAVVLGAALALALEPYIRRIGTVYRRGMLEWDTHWYHAPVAARFAETGDLTQLHAVNNSADSFLPFNTELLHAAGMLATGRDVLSPLINLGWLALAVLAAWCLGRVWTAGAAAVAATAVVAATPVMVYASAGSAGNDLAGIALLLAAAALGVHGAASPRVAGLAGLAAGLAVGTKLTLIAPVIALTAVLAVAWVRERAPRAAAVWFGAVLVTGGFWYLRNTVRAHNPFPWFELSIGSWTLLPSSTEVPPDCGTTSVADRLTDADVVRDVFRPALASAFGPRWGLVLVVALAGAVLALRGGRRQRGLAVVALASGAAYLVTPATAGGTIGTASCFDYNTRFATPALALGLVLFAVVSARWGRFAHFGAVGLLLLLAAVMPFSATRLAAGVVGGLLGGAVVYSPIAPSRRLLAIGAASVVVAVAFSGWFVQDHYYEHRYAAGSLPEPIEASARALRDRDHLRIAVGGFRAHYALYDAGLTNRVEFPVVEGPHGALERITTCRAWQKALRAGRYDYVVTYGTEATRPPPEADWTRAYPGATRVLRDGLDELFALRPASGVACP
jgi:hypothetical protein